MSVCRRALLSNAARVAAILTALQVVPARAAVVEYAVTRTISDTQTSNAQPNTPEFWDFRALVFTDVPNEIVSASVSFNQPPPASYPLHESIATLWQVGSPFYTDAASFLLAYPATTYTLTADLGAGPETGDVFLAEDLYCEAIPYFTGDTYDRLQSYDVTQDLTLTFNGFTLHPSTDVGAIYLSVVEDNAIGAVISVALDPSDTSFVIPANTLTAGRSYSIGLTYYNIVRTPNAGFTNATAGAEFFRSTTAYFTTLPAAATCCPGDFNDDHVVNGLDVQAFVNALLTGSGCP
ncbi:MAG: hypothetical protein U1A27_01845 [Phycisphaerae bacterium]